MKALCGTMFWDDLNQAYSLIKSVTQDMKRMTDLILSARTSWNRIKNTGIQCENDGPVIPDVVDELSDCITGGSRPLLSPLSKQDSWWVRMTREANQPKSYHM